MSFFSKFSDFITSPVGNALTNRPEDVRRVKKNFKTLGIFDEDADNGYITRGLDSAIKTFQRDNDLKVDGRINPRGETEGRIFDILEGGLKKGSAAAKTKPVPRNIGFGTGLTDFMIKRDNAKPKTGSTVTLQKDLKEETPPVVHTVFVADTDKPAERKSHVLLMADKNNAGTQTKTPQTDATGRMIRPDNKPQTPKQSVPPKIREVLSDAKETKKEYERRGYTLSPKFLQHYLNGSGQALKIQPKDIESSTLYSKAIETNQKRFEDSIAKGVVDEKWISRKDGVKIGVPSPFKDQILKLKDGQTIALDNPKVKDAGDAWDRDIKRSQSYIKDPDHARALGAVKLRSLGDLKATRKGNKVEITGEVYHTVMDTYDFNDDTLFDKKALKG